jgi:hypothetical protein
MGPAWVVGLLLAASVGHCGATRWWRVTPGDRVYDAAFSPSGDVIAYAEYVDKRFSTDGSQWAFGSRVGLVRGDESREVVRVPAWRPSRFELWWLPGGRYVYARAWSGEHPCGWLIRARDGFHTAVGEITRRARYGVTSSWFVLNDDLPLTHDEGMALRGYMRHGDFVPPRWLWDGLSYDRWGTHFGGCGLEAPEGALSDVTPRFADLRAAGVTDGNTVRWAPAPLSPNTPPQVWLTCGDLLHRQYSPHRRWLSYLSDASGVARHTGEGQDQCLAVKRLDGSRLRVLARGVDWYHEWLDDNWLVYGTRGRERYGWERQFAVVRVSDGAGQALTKGAFHHRICDYRNGTFLVVEHPLADEEAYAYYTSRLYAIQPQRVRL